MGATSQLGIEIPGLICRSRQWWVLRGSGRQLCIFEARHTVELLFFVMLSRKARVLAHGFTIIYIYIFIYLFAKVPYNIPVQRVSGDTSSGGQGKQRLAAGIQCPCCLYINKLFRVKTSNIVAVALPHQLSF